MSAPDPPIDPRGRGGAPLSGLPFATVVAVSGLTLLAGLGGRHRGGAEGGSGPAITVAAAEAPALAGPRTPDERWVPGLAGVPAAASDRRRGAVVEEKAPATEDEGSVEQAPPLPGARGEGEAIAGLSAEGPYRQGLRHGEWTFHDPSGVVREIGTYREGKRHGTWREFAPSGAVLLLAEFVDGAQHGQWQRFSEAGALLEDGRYESSSPSGWWVRRYTDGALKEQGRYDQGLREGRWEFFDDLGRPTLRTGTYRAGILVE